MPSIRPTNTVVRFLAATEVAAKLIEEGYTEVTVSMEQYSPSSIVFNTSNGSEFPDMLKKKSPSIEVSITVKATKNF